MNEEEIKKYSCNECVNVDCCPRAINICSLFVKRRKFVLEIDGARHVLTLDDKKNVCSCCSLKDICDAKRGAICVALDDNRLYHFEIEKPF